MRKVKVVQKEGAEEVPTEVIAQSIQQISDGVKKMRAGKLNDRAIVFLIAKSSGVGMTDVESVLLAMDGLAKYWLKPSKPKEA